MTILQSVLHNGELFFTIIEDNYLYKLNIETGQLSEILSLGNVGRTMPYGEMLVYSGHLYLIPCEADELVIINIENTEDYITIPIPKCKSEPFGKSGINFFNGLIYDDFLYMFGYSYLSILKYNLKNGELEWVDFDIDMSLDFSDEDGCFRFFEREDNSVFLPFCNLNAIGIFDLMSCTLNIRNIGEKDNRYINIQKLDDYFVLVPRDAEKGSIVVTDKMLNEIQMRCESDMQLKKHAFFSVIGNGRKALIFPHMDNKLMLVDPHEGKISVRENYYDCSNVKWCKYPSVLQKDDLFYIFVADRLIVLNEDFSVKLVKPYIIDEGITARKEKEKFEKQYSNRFIHIENESKSLGLNDLIDYVKHVL